MGHQSRRREKDIINSQHSTNDLKSCTGSFTATEGLNSKNESSSVCPVLLTLRDHGSYQVRLFFNLGSSSLCVIILIARTAVGILEANSGLEAEQMGICSRQDSIHSTLNSPACVHLYAITAQGCSLESKQQMFLKVVQKEHCMQNRRFSPFSPLISQSYFPLMHTNLTGHSDSFRRISKPRILSCSGQRDFFKDANGFGKHIFFNSQQVTMQEDCLKKLVDRIKTHSLYI